MADNEIAVDEIAGNETAAVNDPHATSVVPRLLTIPRELRDKIYAYLHQSFTISWGWTHTHPPAHFSVTFNLEIENAPQPSVLLTHTRLHDEYLEALSHRNLSAAVYVQSRPAYIESLSRLVKLNPELTMHSKKDDEAMAHLRYVIILFDCNNANVGNLAPGSTFWGEDGMQAFATALLLKAPHLSALHIALQYQPARGLEKAIHSDTTFRSGSFLHPPPPFIAGIPLVQRAEGYRLYYCNKALNGALWNYQIVQVGCYTYHRDVHKKPMGWAPRNILDAWELTSHHEAINEPTMNTFNNLLPTMMREWRTKVGHEAAKAWFPAGACKSGMEDGWKSFDGEWVI
ncbi:uncharacterized protein K460DRAFT_402959 [Cucurbitaria berberidis CBS 394.84]|uniref:Uncharacterized protein n=1 Tax=Cucurbitaria berberidis CBS 394.84 TaxID=1168544 RepID=A0A9P4LAX1_9PLEO|nr:uncharacterized protein K460DRAFT_402959 [Cucurbitaria berberidis CBS 394.84]KAF1847624.1 hypothetical protein K460DRAFT_402959 [Cucurbitaria berberidis CBS 394.84]